VAGAALAEAAGRGHLETVKTLIDHGVPADGRGVQPPPLERARGGGHTEVVALLEASTGTVTGGPDPR
jgi:hypothetical protein